MLVLFVQPLHPVMLHCTVNDDIQQINRTSSCSFFQARRLICDRLASLLGFKASTQPPNVDGYRNPRNYRSDAGDRGLSDGHKTAEYCATNGPALTSILDLMESRIAIDDEAREKSDRGAKIQRDWMLAAAVIDRLCFVALIFILAAGTLIFLVLFLHSR